VARALVVIATLACGSALAAPAEARVQRLTACDGTGGDQFGESVPVDGDAWIRAEAAQASDGCGALRHADVVTGRVNTAPDRAARSRAGSDGMRS
jgi:FG-GAP repeat